MTYCHTLCAMSIGPPILRYSYFKSWPWKSMVKVMCVVKGRVTFDLQISKVKIMGKIKPIGHIWGLEFNWYDCFSFHGNGTHFCWDIGNSIFDLENSRSRSWPRSNLMVTFEALEFNWYVCFCSVAIGSFLAEIKQIPYLTLKNLSKGHNENRPKSYQVIYKWGPTIVSKMKEIQKLFQSYRVDK